MGVETKWPEHEKLQALDGANNTIGEFIEWLVGQGYVIARYGRPYEVQAYLDYAHLSPTESEEVYHLTRRKPEGWVEALSALAKDSPDAVVWKIPDHSEIGERDSWGVVALPNPDDLSRRWLRDKANDEALWEAPYRIEELIGGFFDIDPKKLSEEKDAMYQELVRGS